MRQLLNMIEIFILRVNCNSQDWFARVLHKCTMIVMGTNVKGQTTGLVTPKCNQEPLEVKDKYGRSQKDLMVAHCFSTCGNSALLDLLEVSSHGT